MTCQNTPPPFKTYIGVVATLLWCFLWCLFLCFSPLSCQIRYCNWQFMYKTHSIYVLWNKKFSFDALSSMLFYRKFVVGKHWTALHQFASSMIETEVINLSSFGWCVSLLFWQNYTRSWNGYSMYASHSSVTTTSYTWSFCQKSECGWILAVVTMYMELGNITLDTYFMARVLASTWQMLLHGLRHINFHFTKYRTLDVKLCL